MSIDLLNKEFNQIQDFSVCIDATEAIKLVQMLMKHYYDNKHLFKFFDIDDKIMLQLHQDYSISIIITEKLAQQFAGLFKILQRVGRLAYKLELPPHWGVHPVISIAHLEPSKDDIFNRPRPDHLDSVYVEGDTDQ